MAIINAKNYPTMLYFRPCLEAKYFCCFRKKKTLVLWNTLVSKIGALVSIMQPNDLIQDSQNIGIGKTQDWSACHLQFY